MKRSFLKKAAILVVALMFALVSTLAMAQAKQWFVNKDKNGKCSVHEQKAKSATTIAGPFATKDDANKAKEKECPKPKKDSKSAPPPKKTP
jgi:hypothetical protein